MTQGCVKELPASGRPKNSALTFVEPPLIQPQVLCFAKKIIVEDTGLHWHLQRLAHS